MKHLNLTFAVVAALVLALAVPAFASTDVSSSTSMSNDSNHPEIEAAHDADDVNEVEAAEVENEGADK